MLIFMSNQVQIKTIMKCFCSSNWPRLKTDSAHCRRGSQASHTCRGSRIWYNFGGSLGGIYWYVFIFIYGFLERGEGREKEGEKRQCVTVTSSGCLLHTTDWGPGCNPGLCPHWEPNWWPFGSQAGTQPTEPQQLGFYWYLKMLSVWPQFHP